MGTFLEISMYSGFVLGGLSTIAIAFSLLAKFINDNTHDPDADH